MGNSQITRFPEDEDHVSPLYMRAQLEINGTDTSSLYNHELTELFQRCSNSSDLKTGQSLLSAEIQAFRSSIATASPGETLIVLLSTGSFNPPHQMHVSSFTLAQEYIASKQLGKVVAAIAVPSSDDYVRRKLHKAAILFTHREHMLQLLFQQTPFPQLCHVSKAESHLKLFYTEVIQFYQAIADLCLRSHPIAPSALSPSLAPSLTLTSGSGSSQRFSASSPPLADPGGSESHSDNTHRTNNHRTQRGPDSSSAANHTATTGVVGNKRSRSDVRVLIMLVCGSDRGNYLLHDAHVFGRDGAFVIQRPNDPLGLAKVPEWMHVLQGAADEVSSSRVRAGGYDADLVPGPLLDYMRTHQLLGVPKVKKQAEAVAAAACPACPSDFDQAKEDQLLSDPAHAEEEAVDDFDFSD